MLEALHPGDTPPGRPMVGLAKDFIDGSIIAAHRHLRAQLVYASSGVMMVRTPEGSWVVPPHRAVWMPAGTEHEIRISGIVRMRTLYIDPAETAGLPGRCMVVEVTPLLRELILRVVEREISGPPAWGLLPLILDELVGLPALALDLPMPSDRRARRLAEALIAEPSLDLTLGQWSATAGASSRTLARLFRSETGLTFGAWRQRLRLTRSLALLARGQSILSVALELGYDSPSAFTAMFRRALGRAPTDYVGRGG
jgi:AraC-like DNA-binding protein